MRLIEISLPLTLNQKSDKKVSEKEVYMYTQSTEDKILRRIRGCGRGSIVFHQDYSALASPSAVKSAFHRIYIGGMLIKLAHGIYYYPKEEQTYGLGVVYPSIEEIAYAIAKRDKAKIVPMGAYALNKLGLSTQVPMNVVFLTNGTPRHIKIGDGRGIVFKHSSSGKNFAYKSELMMLVVTAMRALGEAHITDEEIDKLKSNLIHVPKKDFDHDIKLAPAWVRKILIAT
jgi:hypothetical protein